MIILISGYVNCVGVYWLDICLFCLYVLVKENSYICLEYDFFDNDDFYLIVGVLIIDNYIIMGGIMVFVCGKYNNYLLNVINKFILYY